MARTPKYTVDNKRHVVKADVAKLSEKDVKLVSKYIALGYTLEDTPTVKIYTKKNIEKFIKDNHIEGFDFDKLAKEKNDNGKAKGFVYALKVFRKAYDDDFRKYMKV